MFKEFSDLRQIRNFNRVILPISMAFFIYTFGWGVTSPVFSIYVNNVTKNAFLTGFVLSITTMAPASSAGVLPSRAMCGRT